MLKTRGARTAALVAIAALALNGCSSAGERPTEQPATVFNPTSPSPTAKSTDLHSQAEAVFREIDQVHRNHVYVGNYSPFPQRLTELTADPYLGLTKELYTSREADQIVLKNLDKAQYRLKPFDGPLEHGAVVILEGCSDFSQVEIHKAGNYVSNGSISQGKYYFKLEGDQLKLFGAQLQQVPSCTLQ